MAAAPVVPRPVVSTDLDLPGKRSGKVRDVYDLPPDQHGPRLLIVATDRISAFDVVMPTPIDGKGRLLTELSTFWLRLIEQRGICKTHLVSTDPTDADAVPESAFTGHTTRTDLVGRSTIARKARVIPIECVVRGYLEGSGWKEYQQTGRVCGVSLPPGLRQCDRLPKPIFTPATKEESGKHDENISFEKACSLVGAPIMERLRALSIDIYGVACEHASRHGILLADTKFEFGFPLDAAGREGPDPMLVDEALTPDSSRFWPADRYTPGGPQPSFDKQFLREYLETLVAKGTWGKQAPGPALPPEVVARTVDKYRRARDLLVGA